MKSNRTIRSILPAMILVALVFTTSYLKAEPVEGRGTKVYNINETAEIDGIKYKITKLEQSQGIGDTSIASDTKTLVIQMNIENSSSKVFEYNSYEMELKKEIETKDDSSVLKNIAETTTGAISPGEIKSIDLVYILPNEKSDFYLCYNTKDEANKIIFKITGLEQ